MTLHDDEIKLKHILEYSEKASKMTTGKQKDDLLNDEMLCLALTRALEIVGEAASRVSVETQQKMPSIPWAQMVGLRNRLIHGYDSVDVNILWDIVQRDLPPLIDQLKMHL